MIAAAIDIGGTKIAVGLVNELGEIIAKETFATLASNGLSFSLKRIITTLIELQNKSQVQFQGIGIACTGPIEPLTGELGENAFLPSWEGLGLVNGLTDFFHLPIAMENDADAAALAECRWGSGSGSNNFLYVTVSTGIGTGLILNGHLYRGVDGSHPEMGHHTIDLNGPLCFCGSHGCWEVLASGPAMARWYQSQLSEGSDQNPMVDARQICELSVEGNSLALKAVNREAEYLGIGLANLITLFSPDCISLGGGVLKSWTLFEPKVREIIKNNCGLVPHSKTSLSLASLGTDVNLLGAAQALYHRFSLH